MEYNNGKEKKEIYHGGKKIMARIIPIPIGPIYPGGPCRGIIHVIQKGDTLYQLGKKYHVSVGQLMFANPFVDVYNLQIGDELCIPATIQPRNLGAEERMQYPVGNTPNGWEEPEDWDSREEAQNWEEDRELEDQEEWREDREPEDQDDWREEQNPEDSERWENEQDRDNQNGWKVSNGRNKWQSFDDWSSQK
jgi:LysM repeat protein